MSLKGTNQEFGRPYNRRIVLETIRQHGPIERAAIARKVGLTVQTVANIIRELEELGLVSGERTHKKSRGSPPMSLTLNPQGAYAIGVNVTPRGIEAALVDLAGDIVASERLNISPPHPDDSFREIGRLVDTFRAKTGGRLLLDDDESSTANDLESALRSLRLLGLSQSDAASSANSSETTAEAAAAEPAASRSR